MLCRHHNTRLDNRIEGDVAHRPDGLPFVPARSEQHSGQIDIAVRPEVAADEGAIKPRLIDRIPPAERVKEQGNGPLPVRSP